MHAGGSGLRTRGAPTPASLLPPLTLALVLALVAGCGGSARAPIAQKQPASTPQATVSERTAPRPPRAQGPRPAVHVVRKGDTLHAIAWRYRLDYRDLVRWNGIRDPNLIFVGQKLRLKAPATAGTTRRPAESPTASKKAATTKPKSKAQAAASSRSGKPASKAASGPLRWVWPTAGKVSPAKTASGAKGIEIRGRKGQDVKAAAPGTVVYSGSGLRGYGELIIIKHNDTFLSAYAHNDARLVAEGSDVARGETIARMGDSEARDVMLHFEIRRNGDAVDPLKYLPRKSGR